MKDRTLVTLSERAAAAGEHELMFITISPSA
jgi:hypothetical protein